MSRRVLPVLLLLFVLVAPAPAILNNPIKLQDIIDKLPSIFLAEVDAVDADNATAVFVPKDDLKGKTEFTRLPVNLKDGVTAPAKKADHTKIILERLAKGRKLILFVKKDGDNYSAWGFVEGTWFQLAGTTDKDDKKTVRWAFLNCEPALRGTFKGTTEELRALVADVVAGKAKAPAPDTKEKPGFGPTVEEEKKKELIGFPSPSRGEGDIRRPPVRRHPVYCVRCSARGAGRHLPGHVRRAGQRVPSLAGVHDGGERERSRGRRVLLRSVAEVAA